MSTAAYSCHQLQHTMVSGTSSPRSLMALISSLLSSKDDLRSPGAACLGMTKGTAQHSAPVCLLCLTLTA